jgi:hypothetical protein
LSARGGELDLERVLSQIHFATSDAIASESLFDRSDVCRSKRITTVVDFFIGQKRKGRKSLIEPLYRFNQDFGLSLPSLGVQVN